MRLVVDTNVFVSAALKEESWPGAVIRWVDLHGRLLKTAATEQEVFEVLARPRLADKGGPLFCERLRRIFLAAERVEISVPVKGCRDPKDDKFLELAVNGGADVIVSGDADLLVLDPFRGISVVNAATFISGYAF